MMLKFWFTRNANSFDILLNAIVVILALSDNILFAIAVAWVGGTASRHGEKALAWQKEHGR